MNFSQAPVKKDSKPTISMKHESLKDYNGPLTFYLCAPGLVIPIIPGKPPRACN